MKRHAELVSASVNLTTDSEPSYSSTRAGIDGTQVHLALFSRNVGLLPQDDSYDYSFLRQFWYAPIAFIAAIAVQTNS